MFLVSGLMPVACHLLGMRQVRVPVDAGHRLDVAAMRDAVGPDTAMVVASAPCYPYGVIDPVGEVAALAMIEAVGRLVPGVVGNPASLVEESHEDGLLEYPVYTKPADWRGRAVPPVLLSGDHGKVAAWRRAQQEERTRERRPDLWAAYDSED